jgi:hypothetical protein
MFRNESPLFDDRRDRIENEANSSSTVANLFVAAGTSDLSVVKLTTVQVTRLPL